MQKQKQLKYETETVSFDDLKPGDRIIIGTSINTSGKKVAEIGTVIDKKQEMIPPKYNPSYDEEAHFEESIGVKSSDGKVYDISKKKIQKKASYQ